LDDDADIASLLQNLIPTSLDDSSEELKLYQNSSHHVVSKVTPSPVKTCGYCGIAKTEMLIIPCNDEICNQCIIQLNIQTHNSKPLSLTPCPVCAMVIAEVKPIARTNSNGVPRANWRPLSPTTTKKSLDTWTKNGFSQPQPQPVSRNGTFPTVPVNVNKKGMWTSSQDPTTFAVLQQTPQTLVNNGWTTIPPSPQTLWNTPQQQPLPQSFQPPYVSNNPWQFLPARPLPSSQPIAQYPDPRLLSKNLQQHMQFTKQ